MIKVYGLFVLFVVLGMSGCSGLKPYPNSHAKNLHIITDKDQDSFFSKVKISLDVHTVDEACQTQYQGTIKLNGKTAQVGIPAEGTRYLTFFFESASLWTNSKSAIHYDTLLKPRDGYDYNIRVRYIDDIYNVSIEEVSVTGQQRAVNRIPLSGCASLESV